jgi:hypothetical protein
MQKQNLFFNILTFDFPAENQTFYFAKDDIGKSHKIHKSLFPNKIDSFFSGIGSNGNEFIYTTFSGEKKGFLPLSIDFTTEMDRPLQLVPAIPEYSVPLVPIDVV